MKPFQFSVSEALENFSSSLQSGLNEEQRQEALENYGLNQLTDRESRGVKTILLEQVQNPLVLLLFTAAIVSIALDEHKDATVIFVIIILNGILGFMQDYRAEKALAALKKLSIPQVTVLRSSKPVVINATELVPGDILYLEAGMIVPADCRIVETHKLMTQEATLTGESQAITKVIDPLEGDIPLAERKNMIFSGTEIVKGRGKALVVATAMETELGKIARMLSGVKRSPTPLQIRLQQLSRGLAVAALIIVAIVFTLGIARGEELKLMLLTALGLAVAAVPEGLPAVATVTLAIGARKMFEQKALIRKLPAVETLGSVTTICSDKTGTLTQNKMTVTKLWTFNKQLNYDSLDENLDEDFKLLLLGGALCNDAHLKALNQKYEGIGEPTEIALIIVAAKANLLKSSLEKSFPRLDEIPFSSIRKRMTTLHEPQERIAALQDTKYVAFTKGAVDYLLPLCQSKFIDGGIAKLTKEDIQIIENVQDQWAQSGHRVLGLSMKLYKDTESGLQEQDLIFVGLFALIDPPREEVKEAVHHCLTAGIRPIMITGDHPLTAVSIAQDLGICQIGSTAITGLEIDKLDDHQLDQAIKETSVFARVAPEHKMRIVSSLQKNNHVVAMTGDGVNDAPALKKADIGVAMGITGTDVSKEASEMVLLNDNFANIVDAVKQGRIVYDNIRKFVRYTLTSNTGEVLVMLAAPFFGLPLPLLPVQILWVNLVTDGLPGLALAVEPAERTVMKRPPYALKEGIFSKSLGIEIIWIGTVMGLVSLLAGWLRWGNGENLEYYRTMTFMVLTMSQMGNALATRSDLYSLGQIGLLSNPLMLFSVSLTFVLQLAAIYTPLGWELLGTTALSLKDLGICLGLSSVVFILTEIIKWIRRRH